VRWEIGDERFEIRDMRLEIDDWMWNLNYFSNQPSICPYD
jgi:hypothetical protein